ncbi:hypothetical protein AVEN_6250-1 [Araneus ventricosus]|uniref:Uncharacterized protein n=1 Tax=Araneus ventricosus TaxID=182803 RepID=A0A4Y2WS27_ARAVE|nr:hypothetical protein AVEN_6250-1 [Araneus ventricosus]
MRRVSHCDTMCRRVTSDSFVQSGSQSKVTMVLCSSTECLYAPRKVVCSFCTPIRSVLSHRPRPQWPSGKVSTSGPEDRRFETRFPRRSAVYGACCTLNHT